LASCQPKIKDSTFQEKFALWPEWVQKQNYRWREKLTEIATALSFLRHLAG
jgi:hypothetical protein